MKHIILAHDPLDPAATVEIGATDGRLTFVVPKETAKVILDAVIVSAMLQDMPPEGSSIDKAKMSEAATDIIASIAKSLGTRSDPAEPNPDGDGAEVFRRLTSLSGEEKDSFWAAVVKHKAFEETDVERAVLATVSEAILTGLHSARTQTDSHEIERVRRLAGLCSTGPIMTAGAVRGLANRLAWEFGKLAKTFDRKGRRKQELVELRRKVREIKNDDPRLKPIEIAMRISNNKKRKELRSLARQISSIINEMKNGQA